MTTAYNIGLFCGIGVGILVIILIKKLVFKGDKKLKYDERQKIKQAEAGRNAFYVLIATNAVYALITIFPFAEALDVKQGIWSCIFIGLTYYACDCIWNEAYFAINQKITKWIIMFAALGAYNLFIGIRSKLLANFMAAIMCFAVVICALVKNLMIKKEICRDEAAETLESEIMDNKEL